MKFSNYLNRTMHVELFLYLYVPPITIIIAIFLFLIFFDRDLPLPHWFTAWILNPYILFPFFVSSSFVAFLTPPP